MGMQEVLEFLKAHPFTALTAGCISEQLGFGHTQVGRALSKIARLPNIYHVACVSVYSPVAKRHVNAYRYNPNFERDNNGSEG